jgi:hypothetical protein
VATAPWCRATIGFQRRNRSFSVACGGPALSAQVVVNGGGTGDCIVPTRTPIRCNVEFAMCNPHHDPVAFLLEGATRKRVGRTAAQLPHYRTTYSLHRRVAYILRNNLPLPDCRRPTSRPLGANSEEHITSVTGASAVKRGAGEAARPSDDHRKSMSDDAGASRASSLRSAPLLRRMPPSWVCHNFASATSACSRA